MSDLRLVHGKAGGKPLQQKNLEPQTTAILTPGGGPARPENDASAHGAPAEIEPGSTLGNYLIVSKIGEGGMGLVYKAHDTTLDRTVALKVLSPHLFRNREFLQRFRVEAQAQARLNGPNIVTLHSMFEVPAGLVLVMEYTEGQTLEQRLHNEGRLSVATTVWVFEQALLGVERAHRMGIVHRDLKPSNIFITTTHEVKLMDFGVAKILDNKELTQVGSMIGTLMYISPEQVKGNDADFRSDVYTLGVTLYEAVTGVLPFEKKTDYEYMDAHLHEQPLPPSALQPGIPQELEDIILKSIAKEPDERFQSAHEFRKALLKVGMVHVRAYRRLKAIRREKDRAALTVPPSLKQSGPAASTGVRALLRQLSARRKTLATIAVSGVASGVAIVLALLLWFNAGKESPSGVALFNPPDFEASTSTSTPAEPQPGTAKDAIADTATAETTPTAAVAETAPPAPPKADPGTASRAHTAKAASRTASRKTRRQPPAEPAPEPRAPANDHKYDALRKAWGG